MYERGAFLLYPAPPRKLSFSQNRLEIGANDRLVTGSPQRQAMLDKMWVPLLSNASDWNDFSSRALPATPAPLQYFDLYHTEVAGPAALLNTSRRHPPEAFEQCSVALVRPTALVLQQAQMKYAKLAGRVREVVVVDAISAIADRVSTDCVVILDAALTAGRLLSSEDLRYGISLWQDSFFDHIVGFSFAARKHIAADSSWRYVTHGDSDPSFSSLLLPAGVLVHRKYLAQLANMPRTQPAQCDWLLLNFLVAQAVGGGPVVAKSKSPLELRDTLSNERLYSICLTALVRELAQMPLQYTLRPLEWTPPNAVTPNPDKYKAAKAPPSKLRCNQEIWASKRVCKLTA